MIMVTRYSCSHIHGGRLSTFFVLTFYSNIQVLCIRTCSDSQKEQYVYTTYRIHKGYNIHHDIYMVDAQCYVTVCFVL